MTETPNTPARRVSVTADMVASVLAVNCAEGDEVASGQVLLVVESMKMEIPISAPVAGTVDTIGVSLGDIVQEGDLMVAIRP